MTSTDTCAAKLGTPGPAGLRVCGQPCVYLAAGQRGNTYEGWHHADETVTDHHAVPERWVR